MRALLPAIGLALSAVACNSDSDDSGQSGYVEPTDVAVTGFKLKADSKILSGLDTVFFSIDLERGLIYNADSLPKGTRVTDLIPVITYSNYISSAILTMEGGQKRQGEVNYKTDPNDSIDFTGKVSLTLTSSAGNRYSYDVKVNVHRTEPDSLTWGETAVSKLPARTEHPAAQRTVQFKDNVTSLIQESDGTFTLSTTADPATSRWERHALTLGFTPRLRSLTATDDALWMLASDGTLHTSADGLDWQSTQQAWHSLLGAYGNSLLGIRQTGDSWVIATYGKDPSTPLPDGFPLEDFSNIYTYKSRWMSDAVAVITGGVTSQGEVSGAVWAYDGTDWACLNNSALPSLRGSVLVPYHTFRRLGSSWTFVDYSTIFLFGGMKEDGTLNTDTYISYDNGINWTKAPTLLQLPSHIPAFWQADNTIATKPMQSVLPADAPAWKRLPARSLPGWYRVDASVDNGVISWDCPYIYLYGGLDAQGTLHNSVWRGVINRLTFVPII